MFGTAGRAVLDGPHMESADTSSRVVSPSKELLTARQLAVMLPFIELFADVDAVFTEDDALSPEKRQMSLGRIYRSWKNARAWLDPDFEE